MQQAMRAVLFLPILLMAMWVPVKQSLPDDISPEEVRKAIAGGVRYLKEQQRPNGSFGGFGADGEAGISGLCTLALLNAGVPPDDPVIQKVLDFLQTDNPGIDNAARTYTTSLQTMVFAQADPKRFRLDILRNVLWLQETQVQSGNYRGAWSYGTTAGRATTRTPSLPSLPCTKRNEWGCGCRTAPGNWPRSIGSGPSGTMGRSATRSRGPAMAA